MTWRVDVGPNPTDLFSEFFTARAIWRRLSSKQRAAILDAYPDKRVVAHPLTLNALERHGLMDGQPKLTEAGRIVGRWNQEMP